MSKHTTLDQLKMLAQRTKGEIGKVDSKMTALSDRVDTLESAGGQANVLEGVKVNGTALSIAEKMVDILIATGTANGTLSVNGKDVAIKGLAALAYKAQVSEADLDSALTAVLAAKAAKADVDTLIGSDAGKSARTIANEELTKQLIPEDAQESLNTLTEIAAWIQEHPDDASAMNAAIAKLNEIAAGIGGEEDDYREQRQSDHGGGDGEQCKGHHRHHHNYRQGGRGGQLSGRRGQADTGQGSVRHHLRRGVGLDQQRLHQGQAHRRGGRVRRPQSGSE